MNIIPLSSEQQKKFEQKGIREKLLCKRCEAQISKYENHARKLFFGGTELTFIGGNPITISNISYFHFKLFQLSLLWRAAISTRTFFKKIKLGPHEDKIRKMIYEENPGKQLTYPCTILGILRSEKHELLDDLIMQPDSFRYDGHRVFRFILGGCFWLFFVSSHTNTIPIRDFILSEDGIIRLPLKYFDETDYCYGLIRDFQKYKK